MCNFFLMLYKIFPFFLNSTHFCSVILNTFSFSQICDIIGKNHRLLKFRTFAYLQSRYILLFSSSILQIYSFYYDFKRIVLEFKVICISWINRFTQVLATCASTWPHCISTDIFWPHSLQYKLSCPYLNICSHSHSRCTRTWLLNILRSASWRLGTNLSKVEQILQAEENGCGRRCEKINQMKTKTLLRPSK